MTSQKPSYSHLTEGINHVPMTLLRRRISKATSRILIPPAKAKRIRVFLNGDRTSNGVWYVLQPRQGFDTLFRDVAFRLSAVKTLRRLYDTSGKLVTSFDDVISGESYVVAAGSFKKMTGSYGATPRPDWTNQSNPRGRRHSDVAWIGGRPEVEHVTSSLSLTSPRPSTCDISDKVEEESCAVDVKDNREISNDELLPSQPTNLHELQYLTLDSPKPTENKNDLPLKRDIAVVYKNDRLQVAVKSNDALCDVIDQVLDAFGVRGKSRCGVFPLNGNESLRTTRDFFTLYRSCDVFCVDFKRNFDNFSDAESDFEEEKIGEVGVRLEWVYGNGQCRNVCMTSSGDVAFASGTLVVLYDIHKERQRFYTGHTENVTCLAASNSGFAASAQQSTPSGDVNISDAHVRVWSLENLAVTSQFGHGILGDVAQSLCFSNSGNLLAVSDRMHVTLWEWRREHMTSRVRGSPCDVMVTSFTPDDSYLVTAGVNHLAFWQINERESGNIVRTSRNAFPNSAPEAVTCVTSSFDDDIITGDTNGGICLWGRNNEGDYEIQLEMKCDAGVTSLCALDDGTLIAGDEGGRIYAWDLLRQGLSAKAVKKISTESVDIIMPRKRTGDDVITCFCGDGSVVEGSFIESWKTTTWGHAARISALAPLPDVNKICVSDVTGHVFCWSCHDSRVEWKVDLKVQISCMDLQRDYGVLLAGSVTSQILAMTSRGARLCSRHVTAPVTCLRFSEKNEAQPLVAVATDDRKVHVFFVLEGGRAYVIKNVLDVYDVIEALDWCARGRLLRTANNRGEGKTWNTDNGRVEIVEKQNVFWSTDTCPESSEISCQSHFGSFRVAGMKDGRIRMFKHKNLLSEFKCTSGEVTSVAVTSQYVFCAGGKGKTPFFARWRINH